MTDLDRAIAAAREALADADFNAYGVKVTYASALADLLAAIDAARGEAVAWQVTVVDNTGTHDYAKWAGLQAPPAQPLVERYGDGVLVHWPEGVEQYVQVGDCVTGYLARPTQPVAWMTAGGDVSRSYAWAAERCMETAPSPLYLAPHAPPAALPAPDEAHVGVLRELSATLIGRSRERHEAIEWALARITAPPAADDRIAAWDSVFETLREVKPDFTHNDKTGMQAACDAIRELAAEAKAPPAAVAEGVQRHPMYVGMRNRLTSELVRRFELAGNEFARAKAEALVSEYQSALAAALAAKGAE